MGDGAYPEEPGGAPGWPGGGPAVGGPAIGAVSRGGTGGFGNGGTVTGGEGDRTGEDPCGPDATVGGIEGSGTSGMETERYPPPSARGPGAAPAHRHGTRAVGRRRPARSRRGGGWWHVHHRGKPRRGRLRSRPHGGRCSGGTCGYPGSRQRPGTPVARQRVPRTGLRRMGRPRRPRHGWHSGYLWTWRCPGALGVPGRYGGRRRGERGCGPRDGCGCRTRAGTRSGLRAGHRGRGPGGGARPPGRTVQGHRGTPNGRAGHRQSGGRHRSGRRARQRHSRRTRTPCGHEHRTGRTVDTAGVRSTVPTGRTSRMAVRRTGHRGARAGSRQARHGRTNGPERG
jgi:hypothetical protein